MSTYRQTAKLMHSNKSWLVKLLRRGNILVFSCGWRQFVEDNTLRVGDACSFELIHRNDYTFNVVILRGNGTPPDKAHGTKTTCPSSSREEGSLMTFCNFTFCAFIGVFGCTSFSCKMLNISYFASY